MRSGAPLSSLMIDADEFKIYNERHGHQAGDRLLQRLAASIAANLTRPSDLGAALAATSSLHYCRTRPLQMRRISRCGFATI
jgi:predicted signal transduction protein with EAL and GGDEF domain